MMTCDISAELLVTLPGARTSVKVFSRWMDAMRMSTVASCRRPVLVLWPQVE